MFGSMVGIGVSVGGGTVGVAVDGSTVGEAASVAVGERGIGGKGVGVGEAFGAAVTRVNGRTACWFAAADAKVPQPVRRYPASSRMCRHLFIGYGDCWFSGSMSRRISGIRGGRRVCGDDRHTGHRR